MFALRAEDGTKITSCEIENFEQEVTYESEEEAEQALELLEQSIPKGMFKVIEI